MTDDRDTAPQLDPTGSTSETDRADDFLADADVSAILDMVSQPAPRLRGPSRPSRRQSDPSILLLEHRSVRGMLMTLVDVEEDETPAFDSRLKHVVQLGIVDDGRSEGRGRRRYRLVDCIELAFCFVLMRAFVPPATAVGLVTTSRDRLDRRWADGGTIDLALDAFAEIGDPSRSGTRRTRGSSAHGAIGIADRFGPGPDDAIPPLRLSIDARQLVNATCHALASAGVDERRLEMERLRLPGR